MGLEYFKRPVFMNGMQVNGASTFTNKLVFDGSSAGIALDTETITTSTAAQTLNAYAVSFITYGTSGKPSDIILPAPPRAGIVKHIFAVNNTTSVELNINTNATANTFWGTTFNTVSISAASTGSPGGTPAGTAYLGLIAASTTQWAIFPGSTFNWDFAASTGSTATA